jgi:hypothetical protein
MVSDKLAVEEKLQVSFIFFQLDIDVTISLTARVCLTPIASQEGTFS